MAVACTSNSFDIVLDTSAECIKRMASIIITNQQNIIINSTNALNIYVDNLKANPNKETHTLGFKLLNEFDELFMGKSQRSSNNWYRRRRRLRTDLPDLTLKAAARVSVVHYTLTVVFSSTRSRRSHNVVSRWQWSVHTAQLSQSQLYS